MPKNLRKRKFAKKMKRRAKPNNLKTFNCNIEAYTIIKNTAGVIGDISISFPLNHPHYMRDTTNAWGQLAPAGNLITRCTQLFDQYRVNSLTVRYISTHQNISALGTGGAEAPSIMYHLNDNNDSNLADERSSLSGGILPTPILSNKMYTFKFKQLKQMKYKYTNVDLMGQNPTSTVTDNESVLAPEHYASLKLYFPNTLPTTWLGRIYAKWNVTFRGVNTLVD